MVESNYLTVLVVAGVCSDAMSGMSFFFLMWYALCISSPTIITLQSK